MVLGLSDQPPLFGSSHVITTHLLLGMAPAGPGHQVMCGRGDELVFRRPRFVPITQEHVIYWASSDRVNLPDLIVKTAISILYPVEIRDPVVPSGSVMGVCYMEKYETTEKPGGS